MSNTPLITIIVLHWRTFAHTYQCLARLEHLAYEHYRVLLVDNGSGDDGLARLQRAFPAVQTLELPTNVGFARAMNRAMRWAFAHGSTAVLLLNNDVLVPPELVGQLMAVQQAQPEIGILSPKVVRAEQPHLLAGLGCTIRTYDIDVIGWNVPDQPDDRQVAVIVDAVFGAAMLITRHVYDAVGLFDERFFFYYEDIDLCRRAQRAGLVAAWVPTVTVQHAVGASVQTVRGLRAFYLAHNRQRYFRKYCVGGRRGVYTALEAVRVLRMVRIKLKERLPAEALGYLAGSLVGLVEPTLSDPGPPT